MPSHAGRMEGVDKGKFIMNLRRIWGSIPNRAEAIARRIARQYLRRGLSPPKDIDILSKRIAGMQALAAAVIFLAAQDGDMEFFESEDLIIWARIADLSPEEIREIVKSGGKTMRVEGMGNLITIKAAAARANISYASARERVKVAGLKPRYRIGPAHLYAEEEIMPLLTKHKTGPKPKITKEDAERIIAMRKAGVPLALIADRYGISISYVSRIANGSRSPQTPESKEET